VAPRPLLRMCGWSARGAWLASCLWLAGVGPSAACDQPPWIGAAMPGSLTQVDRFSGIVAAWFEDPTTRYAHGVLGDTVEAGTLAAQLDGFPNCVAGRITLPETEVFEDLAPRLADLDGDGKAEIIVVQSHRDLGARLVVYGLTPDGQDLRLLAATPNIGRTNRWLAPIGAADLDGDGRVEIAYIDRPHLARTLRVWRYADGTLTEIAAATGLTNHRIGEDFITGGIRDCGGGPEMITANADWTRLVATRLRTRTMHAYRSHTCAALTRTNVGETVRLAAGCTVGATMAACSSSTCATISGSPRCSAIPTARSSPRSRICAPNGASASTAR
jgi:hypothetical protein